MNAHVFIILKDNIRTMSDKVRLFDCIGGFENFGSHGWTSNIAHHALVFMLCGVCKKLKQPVDFYMIRSTNGETLVIVLMEVLDACHNAVLVVVANVFDTGANSVKAL